MSRAELQLPRDTRRRGHQRRRAQQPGGQRAGSRRGDVILRGEPAAGRRSVSEAQPASSAACRRGGTAFLLCWRDGQEMFVTVTKRRRARRRQWIDGPAFYLMLPIVTFTTSRRPSNARSSCGSTRRTRRARRSSRPARTPLLGRRLQEDALLDTRRRAAARGASCVLRVRIENGKSRLTFKGPVQPGTMKMREELETVVGDGEVLLRVLERARPARLVPLREVPRGVRARGRDRRDRRDAGRRVRRDRGQRRGHHVDGRSARARAGRLHRSTRTAACSCSTATVAGSTGATWCSTPIRTRGIDAARAPRRWC